MRAIVGALVQLAVSVGLIAWALGQVDLRGLDVRLRHADPTFLALAFSASCAQALLAALRWHFVNRGLGLIQGYPWHLRATMSGLFFGQVLPSTLGGDAYRLWAVARAGHGYGNGTLSVLCDRAIGLAALLALIGLSLPLLKGVLGGHEAFWGLATLVAVGLGGFGVLVGAGPALAGLARSRPFAAVTAPAVALGRVLSRPRDFAVQLVLGLSVHLLSVAVMVLLARALAVDLAPDAALALVPPVILLSTLPISIAGWGVREGAMIAGFAMIGLGAADALVLSVSFGLINLGVGLIGAAAWGISRDKRRGI